ncbi:MAG: CoA ester lyase [Actinomycetia bacterium]|nr:CoA ester lyase [Actinomycetes bacterium]
MVVRSALFAPANHRRHAEKALTGNADIAILDLEDAVARDEKVRAREDVRALLRGRTVRRPQAYVRINGLETGLTFGDLEAVVVPGLDGIVLPKVEDARQVAIVDFLLTEFEQRQGLAPGTVAILPVVETARGLMQLEAIGQASARVRRLSFGAGDFTLDTSMAWEVGQLGVRWAMVQLVVVSRALGLDPPLDTVFPNLEDLDGLAEEARWAKSVGCQGKTCIHPRQVDVVNAIFTPTPDEVAWAEEVVAAFEAALAAGVASIRVKGRFVDYPIAERAKRVLAVHRELAERDGEDGQA